MYINIFICIYIHIHVDIHFHIVLHMYIYVCMWAHMYVYPVISIAVQLGCVSGEDLMPSPLAEISTEVCWPDRVTAPDLSLIVTTIRRD